MQYFVTISVFLALVAYLSVRLVRTRRNLREALGFSEILESVHQAYQNGEYEVALRVAEGLKYGRFMTPAYWYYRGKTLYQLGQQDEAESCLRKSLALETDSRKRALCQEGLGKAIMEQARYADAVACFEECVRENPERGGGHRGVAEALLREGLQTGEALRRARRAVELDRNREMPAAQVHNINLGEALGTLAWAVAAETADAAEVERLLSVAFSLCGDDHKSSLAQLHYHAGAAWMALAAADRGARHFQQAATIDPQGVFARLCQTAAV